MDLKQEDAVEGIAIGQHTQTHYHSYAMDEERLSAAQSHFASNCFPRNIPDARSQNFRFACNSFIRAVPDAIKSDFLIRDTPSAPTPATTTYITDFTPAPVHVEPGPRRREAVRGSGGRQTAGHIQGEVRPGPGGGVELVKVVVDACA